MASYGWSPEFVDWELDGAQGSAYYHWARQNQSSVWGNGERPKKGYVKMEYEKLMRQYRETKNA